MPGVLVDTNVLVYAHDRSELAKQIQAVELLEGLRTSGMGRLPAQALSEFFNATTRGPQPILPVAEARQQLNLLLAAWMIFDTTPMIVREAARGVEQHGLSFYDAQIWASARLNQVSVIFSEDFASGTQLEGVRFINPFAPEFELAPWIG